MNCTMERLSQVKSISTITKMGNEMKVTTHGTSSSTGLIPFNDRTEQQGKSLIQLYIYLICLRLI